MAPTLQLVSPAVDRTSSWNLIAKPTRTLSLVESLPAPSPNPLWRAAVEAEERATADCRLDDVWQDHVSGRVRAWWESVGPDRILLVAQVAAGEAAISTDDAAIVARILSGEQQKLVASDLRIAASTVSGRYVRALDRLDLSPTTLPLPIVLAAQAWIGVANAPNARRGFFESQGTACMVVSVPRPATARMSSLTPAEQDVAKWIIEGCSRFDIARRRKTSVHTVARQFHAIFNTQRGTGRFALVRSAVEHECFC
jgi:DNA-binding NarL/FixJ family response regulator